MIKMGCISIWAFNHLTVDDLGCLADEIIYDFENKVHEEIEKYLGKNIYDGDEKAIISDITRGYIARDCDKIIANTDIWEHNDDTILSIVDSRLTKNKVEEIINNVANRLGYDLDNSELICDGALISLLSHFDEEIF